MINNPMLLEVSELSELSELKDLTDSDFENSTLGKKAEKEKIDFSDKDLDQRIVRPYNLDNAIDDREIQSLTQIKKNKLDGCSREEKVEKDLEKKYPPEEGYTIIREAYLRDKDGNIVRDPETGTARRIDFVVVKDGKVVDSIEVTGMNVDKSKQMEHEKRVKEEGGVYIRDDNGNLIKVDVNTRIERRP